MQQKELKYGVIGTGHMGRYHVNVVRRLDDINFVGIYDVDHDRSKGRNAPWH